MNDVEFKYVEINNNNCIISKMAAKMAAKNLYVFLLYDPGQHACYSCTIVSGTNIQENQPAMHILTW